MFRYWSARVYSVPPLLRQGFAVQALHSFSDVVQAPHESNGAGTIFAQSHTRKARGVKAGVFEQMQSRNLVLDISQRREPFA